MSERGRHREAGQPAENPELAVTDPDDFNRLQRFKEIHRARQNVSQAFKKRDRQPPRGLRNVNTDNTSERVAQAVSLYVLELEPLFREAVDRGALPEGMARFSDEYYEGDYEYEDVFDFAYRLGTTREGKASKQMSMQIFRKANDIMRRLGLELELDADDSSDAGFDYSDILEEGPPGDGDAPEIGTENADRAGGGADE